LTNNATYSDTGAATGTVSLLYPMGNQLYLAYYPVGTSGANLVLPTYANIIMVSLGVTANAVPAPPAQLMQFQFLIPSQYMTNTTACNTADYWI